MACISSSLTSLHRYSDVVEDQHDNHQISNLCKVIDWVQELHRLGPPPSQGQKVCLL